MDSGSGWLETLNGPPLPVEPESGGAVVQLVNRIHGWFDNREPFENTSTLVTATFNDDPFEAAVETVCLATSPFADKTQLLTQLRQRFLTNPAS